MILDCSKPQTHANGQFECSSNSYAENSVCDLVCDPGFVPGTKASMQCQVNDDGYDWSVPFSDFICIKTCHLVVGGINKQGRKVTQTGPEKRINLIEFLVLDVARAH